MQEVEITPATTADELLLGGVLSVRAHKVMQQASLVTVRDLAAYHRDDPRYLTLGGCGKKTRREFNEVIKTVYGTLTLRKIPPLESDEAAAGSWMARWTAQTEEEGIAVDADSIAAEWENEGTLTQTDRRYYRQCRDYLELIEQRKGIPDSLADLRLHRWFLLQLQSELRNHRALLFNELCERLGLR